MLHHHRQMPHELPHRVLRPRKLRGDDQRTNDGCQKRLTVARNGAVRIFEQCVVSFIGWRKQIDQLIRTPCDWLLSLVAI